MQRRVPTNWPWRAAERSPIETRAMERFLATGLIYTAHSCTFGTCRLPIQDAARTGERPPGPHGRGRHAVELSVRYRCPAYSLCLIHTVMSHTLAHLNQISLSRPHCEDLAASAGASLRSCQVCLRLSLTSLPPNYTQFAVRGIHDVNFTYHLMPSSASHRKLIGLSIQGCDIVVHPPLFPSKLSRMHPSYRVVPAPSATPIRSPSASHTLATLHIHAQLHLLHGQQLSSRLCSSSAHVQRSTAVWLAFPSTSIPASFFPT